MTREPEAKFKVGDIVRVVDTPYKDCPFVWVDEMTDCCGEEVTITDVFWIESLNAHGYSISEDCGVSTWCENCFVQEADIAESDSDISLLIP